MELTTADTTGKALVLPPEIVIPITMLTKSLSDE